MSTAVSNRPYITCQELIDFLSGYLEEALTPAQQFEFERHLAVCPSCVNYLDTYKKTLEFGKRAMLEQDSLESIPEELIRGILSARAMALPCDSSVE